MAGHPSDLQIDLPRVRQANSSRTGGPHHPRASNTSLELCLSLDPRPGAHSMCRRPQLPRLPTRRSLSPVGQHSTVWKVWRESAGIARRRARQGKAPVELDRGLCARQPVNEPGCMRLRSKGARESPSPTRISRRRGRSHARHHHSHRRTSFGLPSWTGTTAGRPEPSPSRRQWSRL